MPASKTVYILGAGFAKAAELPLQAEILKRISDFNPTLMEAPQHVLDVYYPAKKRVSDFLAAVFPDTVPILEDVFTLLDQAIAKGQECRGFGTTGLEAIRDDLKRAILFVLHHATSSIPDAQRDFYRNIGAYLLNRRVAAGQGNDPFCVISLNWDSLLEDVIFWCLREASVQVLDIDYCCYTTPLGTATPHTPSLFQKAMGLFNMKLMKLHGSANWLLCPNCNRLFTGIGSDADVWEQYAKPTTCPQCLRFSPRAVSGASTLQPFFITPTFVKVFDNAHIQMTWHNAYVDLAEAGEVVFLGYSLPDADYHVRTLFRRAIPEDAILRIVLIESDRTPADRPEIAFAFAETRYKAFFGAARANFHFGGVAEYFGNILGATTVAERLVELEHSLKHYKRRLRRRPKGGWH